MSDGTPLLTARGLHKTYRKHTIAVPVLRGLDLDVREHEFLSIIGHSGSGKSTLLHLLGTLDKPDVGEVHLAGRRIDHLPSQERDRLRNSDFGFIFQFYHLLPEMSALENVLLPQMIRHGVLSWWRNSKALRKKATELLERVGLGHRLHHKPRELSGGEMQRTAIARALIGRPRVLFADEPTGNLDQESGAEIVRLLRDLNQRDGLTIIMVTHNLEIVAATDRVVRLALGRIERPAAAVEEEVPLLPEAGPTEEPPGDAPPDVLPWRRAL
jgi:lipoprotein-releasing system ATP-binding protein